MNCEYCRTSNADDEPRCIRCGRRLHAESTAAPVYPATRAASALALERVEVIVEDPAPRPVSATQKLHFAEPAAARIIPFESFAADRIQRLPGAIAEPAAFLTPPAIERELQTHKPPMKRRPAPPAKDERQSDLDFLVPPPQGPRTLKTQVEAVIYCDADVATPRHRAIAAALDGGMIFTGFGLFLFTFHFMGGLFRLNRQTIPFFIGVFTTLAMFYAILWIWAGRETAGMRWTGLRLIDFDGFPANRHNRILRGLAACLSFCAGGIGLLWALVDEERLAWHDHMSKTFPTLQESNSTFSRKG